MPWIDYHSLYVFDIVVESTAGGITVTFEVNADHYLNRTSFLQQTTPEEVNEAIGRVMNDVTQLEYARNATWTLQNYNLTGTRAFSGDPIVVLNATIFIPHSVEQMPRRRDRTAAVAAVVEQTNLTPDSPITGVMMNVVINLIDPADRQRVRGWATEALIDSVRLFGVMEPIVLRRATTTDTYQFDLIAGARRLDAAISCGHTTIAANVYPAMTPRSVAAAMSLTENLVRGPNPGHEAREVARLLALGHSAEDIRERLHLDRASFRQRLRLSSLPEDILQMISERRMSASVGVEIAQLNITQQRNVFESVRDGVIFTVRGIRELHRRTRLRDASQTDVEDQAVAQNGASGEPAMGPREAFELLMSANTLTHSQRERIGNLLLATELQRRMEQRDATMSSRNEAAERPTVGEFLDQVNDVVRAGRDQESDDAHRVVPRRLELRSFYRFGVNPAGVPIPDARREQADAVRSQSTPPTDREQQRQILRRMPQAWHSVATLVEIALNRFPDTALYTEDARRHIALIQQDANALLDSIQPYVESEA